ncbi:MAG TPA: F0F1 ATP synthase subunit B [Pseudolysinimonas sp.]|nr:F0F1 ATP synthase subunit B [Pseudolysinimonas sp.]
MLSAFVPTAESPSHSVLIPELPDLVWGTIAFVIVLVVIIWKVLPGLNKALDARADAIEGGLKRAEEAQAEANSAKENFTAQLAEARAEASRIREAARDEAKVIRADLVEQAQAEAARIVANAQTQIESERAAALVSLRGEVGSLALDLASGVIGESLNDDKKAASIVDRFLADLEASEKAGNGTKAKAGK